MSYEFTLEIETGKAANEVARELSRFTGIDGMENNVLIHDEIWMHVGEPIYAKEIEDLCGIVVDTGLLIRQQRITPVGLNWIVDIFTRLLEEKKWKAVMLDEQPCPVFLFLGEVFEWNDVWYGDLEESILKFVAKRKLRIRTFDVF